jgi:hypothetical protein
MGFLLRAGQVLLGAAAIGAAVPSCYSAGAGTAPPPQTFYFPVGLAVSGDGNVLYAVNSDFDLQWNGGTLQSYDLSALRKDAALLVGANLSGTMTPPAIPFLDPSQWRPGCTSSPPRGGIPLGQECSPPVDSKHYFRHSATIGAFATDLQISIAREGDTQTRRLFIPVRGDGTLTWARVGVDPSDQFKIECGQGADGRCGASHQAGNDPNMSVANTRHVTMPGEPFGMAQSEDGTAIAITHQADTKASLFTTGLPPSPPGGTPADPSIQFVLDGLPVGGVGIAAVPHDPDAPVKRCEDPSVSDTPPCVRPAFLETNRYTAELDLLRFYDDDGSSQRRPFLQREAVYPITSNAVGSDSRGIVIDPTPRIACKALPGADPAACAQLPARVFFASRTPPALGIGEIGGAPPNGTGSYDPDRLVLTGNVPLPPGPSKIYLAPIVDPSGKLAVRVFIVCYDASQVVIYDPDAEAVEARINVGVGPFAMAFDPFLIKDLGEHNAVVGPTPYRFAYVASFIQSYVQMIDLDNSQPTAETFEHVVFTLGQPTVPKGQ